MTEQQRALLEWIFNQAGGDTHTPVFIAYEGIKQRTIGALWRKGFISWNGETRAYLTPKGADKARHTI